MFWTWFDLTFSERSLKKLKENVIGTELGKVVAPKGKLLKVQYTFVCILFALKIGITQLDKGKISTVQR